MGQSLSSEELKNVISLDFRLPASQIRTCRTEQKQGSRAVCLVHEKWLECLSQGQLPDERLTIHTGSACEHSLILQPSHPGVDKPWKRVCVSVLKKPLGYSRWCTALECQTQRHPLRAATTFVDLLWHITEENYRDEWKRAWVKYNQCTNASEHKHSFISFQTVLHKIVKDVYGVDVVQFCPGSHDAPSLPEEFLKLQDSILFNRWPNQDLHPRQEQVPCGNIIPLLCAVETQTAFYLVEPFYQHSVQDIVTFSPAVLSNSTVKPLFIIYQILHALTIYHRNGIVHGNLTLSNVLVYKGLWIQLGGVDTSLGTNMLQNVITDKSENTSLECVSSDVTGNKSESTPNSAMASSPSKYHRTYNSSLPCILATNNSEENSITMDNLPFLVDSWVRGHISNFDYLLALNHLAGRRMGDPNYHPVLPWVIDFTSADSGYRDLSKSKFRLNKGDHQLDLMFENCGGGSIPHHVSDVLSDITYLVYLARQTPKSVLCSKVRTAWVPNEYPVSMLRMYDWTPDECIPEFFTDPSIFQSIHDDLPDLELPPWATSPEDFINKHRQALESEYVNSHLHLWIDLMFGYKLSGSAAVVSKNVCLHLVDQHSNVTNHGIVQLFNEPHPPQGMSQLWLPSIISVSDKMDSDHSIESVILSPTDMTVISASEVHDNSNAFVDICVASEEGGDSSVVDGQCTEDKYEQCNEDGVVINQINHDPGSNHNSIPVETQSVKPLTKKVSMPNLPSLFKPKEDVSVESTAIGHISLPVGYNPLEELDRFEKLLKFKQQCLGSDQELQEHHKGDHEEEDCSFDHLVSCDMQQLGCLVTEMFCPGKMKLVPGNTCPEQRIRAAKDLVQTHQRTLPRFVREGVLSLLHWSSLLHDKETVNNGVLDLKYEKQSHEWPVLHPELLLQTHLRQFPFPNFFKSLHSFLEEFYSIGLKRSTDDNEDCDFYGSRESCIYNIEQISFALEDLPRLLPDLNKEGVDLLLLHLEPLFTQEETQLHAFVNILDLFASCLGPHETSRVFLKPLLQLFESETLDKLAVVLDKSFLSKLIVHFGLDNFLFHFVGFMIEGVVISLNAGRKDGAKEEKVSLASNEDVFVEDVGEMKRRLSSFTNMESNLQVDCLINDAVNMSFGSIPKSGDSNLRSFSSSQLSDTGKTTLFEEEFASPAGLSSLSALSKQKTQLEEAANNVIHTAVQLSSDLTHGKEPTLDVTHAGGESCSNVIAENSQSQQNKDGAVTDLMDGENGEASRTSASSETDVGIFVGMQPVNNATEVSELAANNEEELEDDLWSQTLQRKDSEKAYSPLYPFAIVGSATPSEIPDFSRRNSKESSEDETQCTNPAMISTIACDSIMWLAPIIGPVLTSRYIIRPMLQLLTRTLVGIVGQQKRDNVDMNTEIKSSMILECLGNICALFGEAILLKQYLPYIETVLNSVNKAISPKQEAGLAAGLVLVLNCLPHLPREILMEHFESTISVNIIQPIMKVLAFSDVAFPGGPAAREVICFYLVDVLNAMCRKLEREGSRELMTPIMQQFFSYFESVNVRKKLQNEDQMKTNGEAGLSSSSGVYEELCQVFSPALAHHAYIPFCAIMGSTYMDRIMYNQDFIWQLCTIHDSRLSHSVTQDSENGVLSNEDNEEELDNIFGMSQNASGLLNVGGVERNESQIKKERGNQTRKESSSSKTRFITTSNQHLKGNWRTHWESQLGTRARDNSFVFNELKLQTFTGHSGPVKDIYIQNNEYCFFSASKDKTVKLWRLTNHGDGTAQSASPWTSDEHAKSVFSVQVLEPGYQIASCDGTIYLWDHVKGTCLARLETPKNNPVVAMTTMGAPSPCLITGMSEGTVRFVDVRQSNFVHEWKATTSAVAGSIRCLSASPDGSWIAVGFSSGLMSCLDVRGGVLRGQWRSHDGEILQMSAFSDNSVLASGVDRLVLWKNDGVQLASSMKASQEPLQHISVYRDQIISATTSNKIGVHSLVEDGIITSESVKLKGETLKGSITALGVLPLNKLLLLATENGDITLLS